MQRTATAQAYLNADVPITADAAERLGRMGFVRLLARRVLAYRGDRALVVGICGPWGSGKTSIVNLLLGEIRAAGSAAGRPVLEPVKFTPWALGTRDDLAQDVLGEIGRMVKDRSSVGAVGVEIGTFIGEVTTALALAGAAHQAGLPEWLSTAIATVNLPTKVAGTIPRMFRLRTAPSLHEATTRVATKIRDTNALLVVALDDLERLPIEQILAVFRVVSAIADFPNTVYLLCMDRYRVAEALDDEYGDGHAYLEKFLNLTFDVPPADPDLLGALFVEQLNQILSSRSVETDNDRFSAIWHFALNRVLRTPRDVVRVLNSFDMALEAIAPETDPVDLLALEALRVLEPGVHGELVKRPFGVLRQSKGLVDIRNDELKRGEEDFATIVDKASEDGREATRALLLSVFPTTVPGCKVDHGALHRQKRAASVDHFDNYFRWSLASGALSEVALFHEIDRLVLARRDPDLEEWFARNDVRFAHLGEKLSHYVEALKDPLDVAAGLLRVAHRLGEHGFFVRSKHLTAIGLACHLIRRSPASWDAELWTRCEDTSWLYGLTHLFAMQCSTDPQERYPELTAPSEQSRAALSSAILRHIQAGRYDEHPSLVLFLFRWRDVAGDGAAREWVRQKVARSEPLVWSIVEPLMNGAGMQTHRNNLEALFDLSELRSFVQVVPHPRDAASIVAETRRVLDMEET